MGSLRVTIIPLFIFAGSKAQLDIPMNATRSSLETRYILESTTATMQFFHVPDHHYQNLLYHLLAVDAKLLVEDRVMLQLILLHPKQQLIQMMWYLFFYPGMF